MRVIYLPDCYCMSVATNSDMRSLHCSMVAENMDCEYGEWGWEHFVGI